MLFLPKILLKFSSIFKANPTPFPWPSKPCLIWLLPMSSDLTSFYSVNKALCTVLKSLPNSVPPWHLHPGCPLFLVLYLQKFQGLTLPLLSEGLPCSPNLKQPPPQTLSTSSSCSSLQGTYIPRKIVFLCSFSCLCFVSPIRLEVQESQHQVSFDPSSVFSA